MSQPVKLQLVRDAEERLPELPRPRAWWPGHDVQFYESEEFLYTQVASFLAEGLRSGQPLVVIATETHLRAIQDRLRGMGVDVDSLVHGRDAHWLNARDTLAAFMEGGAVDRDLFDATVGAVFARLMKDRRYLVVRAYGEMVDLLWKAGNIEGAITLEELWNQLAVKYSFSLLCAYAMGNFVKESHTRSFRDICDLHAHVMPTEEYALADESERLRQITLLQQQARALEAEVAHRKELEASLRETLAHRRRVEESLRRSEQELRDFLENAVEPMHWVGPDGIVLWANRAELELLGCERADVIGHHIAEFHADAKAIGEILARLARNEDIRELEATIKRKDGTIRHVLVNSNVYRVDGTFVHTRCFTRDITHLKRAQLPS